MRGTKCRPFYNVQTTTTTTAAATQDTKFYENQVTVFSNEDCYSSPTFAEALARDVLSRIGITSVVANAPDENGDVLLFPVGRGYVANKNKIVGTVRGGGGGAR